MRDTSDIRVAKRAELQHGRINAKQLRDAGVDRRRTHRWVTQGRLHRVHYGVYAVGHAARSMLADFMAATLVFAGAVISHLAAAYLLKLLRGPTPPPEITVPTTAGLRRPGILIHRVKELHWRDVMKVDNIPVTNVPRTLLDLAPHLPPDDLARACHEAWVHHRVRPEHVEACIARNPRKPGIAKLRAALGADVLLSDLEKGFLALLRKHDLPLPRTNVDHHGDKVDCHWPDLELTIELVSFRYHATRDAFENDVARRRRSNHVAYSYGDVFERPAQTIADLKPRLQRR
jgi:hypothetical protein